MEKRYCDICEKRIDEDDKPWALKLYKNLFSKQFFTIKEICDDCAYKIKKYIKTLE